LIKGDYLEDTDVDGRIILKWFLETLDKGLWTKSIWLRIGTGGELLDCCNEPSGSIKCG
jgi:hypothetical protein